MKLTANWIWLKPKEDLPYNQTIIARKTFSLVKFETGMIRITADSTYRLYVNDRWMGDGPCRSWTKHYRYDEYDVSSILCKGQNKIEIISVFYGVGVLTRQVKEPGLLAQLDLNIGQKKIKSIGTDGSWEVAKAMSWISNTPKISLNMGPYEQYDATLEEKLKFTRAHVIYPANGGPWKNLLPRDVAPMSRQPFSFKSLLSSLVVEVPGHQLCLPAARLTHPGLIETNAQTSMFCGMATMITVKKHTVLQLETDAFGNRSGGHFEVTVDGKKSATGLFTLTPGKHIILVLTVSVHDHHGKEKILKIISPEYRNLKLSNPLGTVHKNPWCYLPFEEYAYAVSDFTHFTTPQKQPAVKKGLDEYKAVRQNIFRKVQDLASFKKELGDRAVAIREEEMFCSDTHWKFRDRKVVGEAEHLVDNSHAMFNGNRECTTIHPAKNGDVELCLDLGEQNVGYYQFELVSEEQGKIDIAGVEYVTPAGDIAHTYYYRNSLHYITKPGLNIFTSLKRRSGRYVYLTLRGFKKAVRIRYLHLIESTYPVNAQGSFACSDERLNQIWNISARTLKLCMEDTYTDCPLYEQTFWVGDARNEALFGYPVFGAQDLGKRCIRLAAQITSNSPLVACQGPNDWDVHLPAWSFLWGISVWDYYWYSGDKKFIKEIYPAVIKNIKGAESLLNENNLFSGPFWNMFDWSGADQNQEVVLHNSMFIVGAIDAAEKCARVIGDKKHVSWLSSLRKKLCTAINSLWDNNKRSYLDSVHDDGSISSATCVHTNFLSILYDIVEKKNYQRALKNVLNPPKKMVRIGSPYASLYLYETLEKTGNYGEIIDSIYEGYLPMIERGETTVTERFGSKGGKLQTPGGHRSRAHAWSSSPVFFLNRIILGIRQTSAGSTSFEISPSISHGITSCRGSVVTPFGPLRVNWQILADKLHIEVMKPKGITTKVMRNITHKGLTLVIGK